MFNIPYKNNSGVFRDIEDPRDYKLEIAFGSSVVDWDKGFDINVPLKVEDQALSLSCVGQTFSKYAEVLNYLETGKLVDMSAKSIYGLIFLQEGGAYLRDACKVLKNRGVNTELAVPSYDNGKPPNEQFFRNFATSETLDKEAIVYGVKDYYSVSCQMESLAKAIQLGNGVAFAVTGSNAGWNSAYPRVPKQGESQWGHAVFGTGFGIKDGKKFIKFINSWGKDWGQGGYGYLTEDYFINNAQYVFPGWTLIDKKNENMQLVKDKNGSDIYLISKGKKIMIVDMPTLDSIDLPAFAEGDVSAYPDGGTLVWTERIIN